GSITQPEYVRKKAQLVNDKKEIENKLAAFAREGRIMFEPVKRFYELCAVVGESAVAGSSSDNLQIMRKIGSNFLLGGQKIKLKFNFPSEKVRELRQAADFGEPGFKTSEIWRPLRDSNP
ncbi:MAG TPA: hypothetical protein PKI19_14785, partial [Elusimicrobiales bacterium]|nr:hypothetical protein [Elusimicrobiales bacterium]